MPDKVHIYMRRDLAMRRGKEIAQACHAVLLMDDMDIIKDLPVITFKATSEDDLTRLEGFAVILKLNHYTVHDAGHTEVPAGTPTCIAVIVPHDFASIFKELEFDLY